MPTPPLRKDSARTRRSILDAAEKLLAVDAQASFTEISVAAGVSPATVYRHFADRPSLLIALLERSLAEIEAAVGSTPVDADSFEAILRLIAVHQARYQGVLYAVRRGEVDGGDLADLEARTIDLFREPFAVAKEVGKLVDHLEPGEVISLLAMIDGALSAVTDQRERERAATRAVEVILNGIRVTS